MTDLRQRIADAYDNVDCPHPDRIPPPCTPCVVAAVADAIGAPVEGQQARVDLLAARLIETEVARLEAVRDGHWARHNDLANMNRHAIGEAAFNDLRSLVTRWMLQLGKAAYEAKEKAR